MINTQTVNSLSSNAVERRMIRHGGKPVSSPPSTTTAKSVTDPARKVAEATETRLSQVQAEPSQAAEGVMDVSALVRLLLEDIQSTLETGNCRSAETVATRIALEVERICSKSDRIQVSGAVRSWQLSLARHRLQKCLEYYQLGSKRGRVELHSSLSVMVYRHIASVRSRLGFQARYNQIEDFLQSFYAETLKAFRRENQLPQDYTPHTRLELSEYMAFTEHYAKRRISLPGGTTQRLIVLRAQSFARHQPPEMSVDIELAVESARGEEAEIQSRSPAMQQIREKMVAAAIDPSESVLRDRVVSELVQYLEEQQQQDCIDYLVLRLQDLSASEIDEVLGLSSRQRDYLQQRFKYHLEKFSRHHQWQLVHQWLGADLDQNLGMPPAQWQAFIERLSPEQQKLLQCKQAKLSDAELASALKCTPKQAQKRWYQILELAWETRNTKA